MELLLTKWDDPPSGQTSMIIGIDIAIHFHPHGQKTSFLIWIHTQPPQSGCEVQKKTNLSPSKNTSIPSHCVASLFWYALEV